MALSYIESEPRGIRVSLLSLSHHTVTTPRNTVTKEIEHGSVGWGDNWDGELRRHLRGIGRGGERGMCFCTVYKVRLLPFLTKPCTFQLCFSYARKAFYPKRQPSATFIFSSGSGVPVSLHHFPVLIDSSLSLSLSLSCPAR